jgi:hypothetical protein
VFEGKAHGRAKRSKLGQVVVEVLLVLPVFLTIVFTIMDLGLMAFWMIVLNHATYEAARAGALLAGPDPSGAGSGGGIGRARSKAQDVMRKAFPNGEFTVDAYPEDTWTDSQAGVLNRDLVVTTRYVMQFSFPMSNILLSSNMACPQGPGGGKCRITAIVRMPIEQPLKK